jgi:uncharacterized RDD family membrane protein YckC
MSTIIVPTTQNIELEYPVASLGERLLGGLIDLILLLAYAFIWNEILTRYDQVSSWEDYTSSVVSQLVMLPAVLYTLLSEWFFEGRTLGKWLTRTRTIRLDGSSPSLSHYLIRWMLRIVDVWLSALVLLPGLIGLVSVGISKKGQRLGDLAAGTTVIKLKLVYTFGDTIFVDTADTYQVVFPQIESLSDRDISILKEVMEAGLRSDNPQLLARLASKVKEVAGIETDLGNRAFLETIMRDYNHLFGRR